jgi:hypothetical protein
MRILNNNPLDVVAAEGERLEVVVFDGAENAVVTCVSPGAPNGVEITGMSSHIFTVPPFQAGVQEDCRVRVRCTFKTAAGGFCEVRLRDFNGNHAHHTFNQTGTLVTNSVRFSIEILTAGGTR